jgi:CheY-like chemotaxis protein
MVHADKRRLLQILANLLTNAAKYTPEGGLIEVGIDVEDAHVVITVRDNGVGMTAEFAEHAFDLFAQADRQAPSAQSGLGIGLALVKRLLELHGGAIHAHSEGLGKGCTMTVCLPRLARATNAPRQRAPVTRTTAPRTGSKLLLADDNADAADLLATLLQAAGHDVKVAHTARDALALAKAERPDACLLNIGLPDMSGYALARHLREQESTRDCLLIAVTGFGQPGEMRAAFESGFDYHFVKPIPIDRLSELLTYGHLRQAS